MFKKQDPQSDPPAAHPACQDEDPPRRRGSHESAVIGSSIRIKGDLSGDEDLLLQGRVEGTIDLKQHAVTVGRDGQVHAQVQARSIAVEGRVEGDLLADEQVVLRSQAEVLGNIVAPRVTLEDGCKFRGSIDMEGAQSGKQPGGAKLAPVQTGAESRGGAG